MVRSTEGQQSSVELALRTASWKDGSFLGRKVHSSTQLTLKINTMYGNC